MSLETKIEQLTVAITKASELLATFLEQQNAVTKEEVTSPVAEKPKAKKAKAKVEPEAEPEAEVKAKSEVLSLTHEDAKEALMKAARRDRKDECRALLESYGAKKISEVKESDLADFIEKCDAL